jgi:hypothetical protein
VADSRKVWTPPPGWPTPPQDWVPEPGWQPDPSWPPAPPGWQFWQAASAGPVSKPVIVGRWMRSHKIATGVIAFVAIAVISAAVSPADHSKSAATATMLSSAGSHTTPSPTPSPVPTVAEAQPTPEATPEPTPEATPQPTPEPTPDPTPVPTSKPKPKPAPQSSKCDPNYSGCVPIASDVDCAGGSGNGPAYVQGPVRVTGDDIYGLDSDHDGIGCES